MGNELEYEIIYIPHGDRGVLECPRCGADTANWEQHTKWHRWLIATLLG